MNIIAVTACTAGIAHTYIAKEKLEVAAKELGHEIKVETQGTIGVENILTEEDILRADVVILASDIKISREERFQGKPTVSVPVSVVMKNPKSLLLKVAQKIEESEEE